MNALSRLLDAIAGRDPADAVAEATYNAMVALPPYAELAQRLAAADRAERIRLLDAADDATKSAALSYLQAGVDGERNRRLEWMRDKPERIAALKRYFASHVADFITCFGLTVDPRLIAQGKPARQPFVLWPKQRDLVEWIIDRWKQGQPGTIVKSRDVGLSWVSVAILATLCIFNRDLAAGIGSAIEDKLDRSGDPDTLFAKLRLFVRGLPPEFNGGYDQEKTDNYLRISFPATGSSITGESGDLMGRGGRKSIYLVDEAAFVARLKLIDANLSANTDCAIYASTPNGIANSFYDRAHNAAIPRFDLSWRNDPRKNDAWLEKKRLELDSVTFAQEILADFSASVAGVVIPAADVQAAIDLHLFLGIEPAGKRAGALDVGDTGDRSAFSVRHGCLLLHVESFKSADIFKTTQRAFALCDEWRLPGFDFDADGLGAGVRGDARVLNEQRESARAARGKPASPAEFFQSGALTVTEYRGSSSPTNPDAIVPRTNRTAKDYYANRKAQSWMHLASMFRESAKARAGLPYDKEMIISIDSRIKELPKLMAQLSQATMSETAQGRVIIDKSPDGASSPDAADSVVILYAPGNGGLPPMSGILKGLGLSADGRAVRSAGMGYGNLVPPGWRG